MKHHPKYSTDKYRKRQARQKAHSIFRKQEALRKEHDAHIEREIALKLKKEIALRERLEYESSPEYQLHKRLINILSSNLYSDPFWSIIRMGSVFGINKQFMLDMLTGKAGINPIDCIRIIPREDIDNIDNIDNTAQSNKESNNEYKEEV